MQMENIIQSFDLKRNYASIREEINDAVQRVLDSQSFILGEEVVRFETAVANYLGAQTIGCASGTDALILALMALNVGPGDEVITTPFSFFATASCITRLGAKPVFVDVEEDTYNMRLDKVLQRLTPKTKVVLPVHLFGQMCRLEEIERDLSERGVHVVEDCAQAFGAHRIVGADIKRAGTWGDVGCFSFFPTKNLGCYGDGGLVCANDEGLVARLRSLRVHGSSTTYYHEEVGLNSRLDALQAAILSVRLRHIEKWTEERREVAARYRTLFAEASLLDTITIPKEDTGNRHTYHQYVVRAPQRDALKKYLDERGIVTRVYYPLCLHMQPCFKVYGGAEGDYPVAERLTSEVLALPMYPELTAEEQERVVAKIASFYAGK